MRSLPKCLSLLILAAACFAGCSRDAEFNPVRKKTFPVTGKVTVNGKEPGAAIEINCVVISEADTDPARVSNSVANTQPDGTFKVWTYDTDDVAPEGEYGLTFSWRDYNMMSKAYTGPDKFKGRYGDGKKSEYKLSIKDKPVDLGVIDLEADESVFTKKSETDYSNIGFSAGDTEDKGSQGSQGQ